MPIEMQINTEIENIAEFLGYTVEEMIHVLQNASNQQVHQQNDARVLDVIEHFSAHIANHPQRSVTTKKSYNNLLSRLKVFLTVNNEQLTISQLNEEILYEFLNTCQPRKATSLANRTINTYSAIVRAMLEYAYNHDFTNRDFRKRFRQQKLTILPRYLKDHEIVLVLKKALQRTHGYRCHAILSFLIGTGCRVNELVNVRIQDFDIENNLLFIKKGKGNKERYVTIFPKVKTIVLDYLSVTGVKSWDRDMSGFLFSKDYGVEREAISVRSVEYLVQTVVNQLGWENKYTVHSFRHTFAVNCLKAGMPLAYLCQLLGHSNPATTNIYTQLFPEDLKNELMSKYPFSFEKLLFPVIGVE